jgi:hypothetical protein
MGALRELLDNAKEAKQRNLTYKQLLSLWQGRKEALQVARNFKGLEGSWLKGMKRYLSLFTP